MPILDPEEPGRFSGEHASGMFGRMGADLRRRGESILEDQASFLLGEILMEESLLRTGGNVIGGAGDLIMEGAMTFLKEGASDEENRLMTQAFKRIMESGPAKATLEKIQSWAQENPRLAKDLFAAVDVAAVVPGVKVARGMFRDLGKNLPVVWDKGMSYGPLGRLGQVLEGTKQSLLAVPQTVKAGIFPSSIAGARQLGVGKHRFETDIASGDPKAALTMGNTQSAQLDRGPVAPIAREVDLSGTVSAKNRQGVSDQLFKNGVNIEFDVPPQVQERMLRHLYAAQKVKDKDIIEVRRSLTEKDRPTDLAREAVGEKTTSSTVIRNLMSQPYLGKYAEFLGKKRRELTTEDLIPFMETSILRGIDLKKLPYSGAQISHLNFLKVERGLKKGRPLDSFTEQQRINYFAFNKILKKRGRLNIERGKKGDDHLYINTSYNSADKVVGGVNNFIAINPKTGEIYSMISDRTDLLKFDLAGAKHGAVTVQPVQKSDFHRNLYGERIDAGHTPMSAESRKRIQDLSDKYASSSGIKRKPGQSAASHEVDVLTQQAKTQVKPELQDYGTAARRLGLLGAAGTPLIQEGGLFEGSY